MKYLVGLAVCVAAFAQSPAGVSNARGPASAEATPAPAAGASDQSFSGSIDLGYRFRTDVRGSLESYRSVVDLSEGPRLTGIQFTMLDPKCGVFDRLDASGYNWGDPYNTASVRLAKKKLYDLRFDYRNVLYFNALPSFANLSATGGFNERWYDERRRMSSLQLDLIPGRSITPYLAWDRVTESGTAIWPWIGPSNEYPVPVDRRDLQNDFRGGLRFEFSRFHMTLEQGGTTFKNDDKARFTGVNYGNRTSTVLSQTLQLTDFMQAYGVRTSSIYEKALVTANPFSWMSFSGQFLYSMPKTESNYVDVGTGSFADAATLLLYTGQIDNVSGSTKSPHIAGNAGLELRPFRSFRILASWSTNRFHTDSFTNLRQQLAGVGTIIAGKIDPFVSNYNQSETSLIWDLTSKLTLRGGYRYEWGDMTAESSNLSQLGELENGRLNRQVGIGALTFRPFQKLSANVEYQGSSTTHAYFRTSLYNYKKARGRVRFQPVQSILLQANFSVMDNQNPNAGVKYDFRSRDNSVSLHWTPAGGKRIGFLAEYSRYTLSSDVSIVSLPFLTAASSRYRDKANLATAALELGAGPARLTVGGSLSVTTGTRPTQFYQPLAKLSIPFGKRVSVNGQWQWYGFNEDQYIYEQFRTHVVQLGFRVVL